MTATLPTENRRRHGGEAGFTLVEVALAMAFLMPVLLGAVQLTQIIGRSVGTNATSSQSQGQLQRAFQLLSDFVQTSKMSTLRMQAVASDVALGYATAIGEWIDPTELVWRPGIQFLSATGELSINARLSTSMRRVMFGLERGELDNDRDDDGDGLVDEGFISLLHEGMQVAIVQHVEHCNFMLEGRLLHMRIGVARRAGDSRIDHAVLQRSIYLRNN